MKQNLNPFNEASWLFPFRWFIIVALGLTTWLVYANVTGWRLFYSPSQEQFSASGPGYHK